MATATYPPPPPYYKLYKSYLQNPDSAPEPPPPVQGTYVLYGANYTTDDVLPTLEEQGVRQLYPKGPNVRMIWIPPNIGSDFAIMGGKRRTNRAKEFCCNLCSRSFHTRNGLVNHNQTMHKHIIDSGGKECPKCFGIFLTKADFLEHQSQDHGKGKK